LGSLFIWDGPMYHLTSIYLHTSYRGKGYLSCSYWSRYIKSFSNSVPEPEIKNTHSFLNISPSKITSQVNKSFLSAGDPTGL
jgi:hypothetical protein